MSTAISSEREALRAAISAHLDRQRAARILDEQRAERAAIREAAKDAAAARASMDVAALARGERPDVQLLTARRRDQYRAALSFPMTSGEVLAAAQEACAHLPDSVERDDTVSILEASVRARHGRNPIRADVGRSWLAQRAERIHARECKRREHSTGLRASADMIAAWKRADSERERPDASGPDAIWLIAASMPAPDVRDQLSADQVIARLGDLTPKQREALALTLASEQRVSAAMTGAQRVAANAARAILRKRFPDADSVRFALRPERALSAAVDQAQRIARERATVAGYGSHLPGHRDSAGRSVPGALRGTYGPLRLTDSLETLPTEREQRAASERRQTALRAESERRLAMYASRGLTTDA